MRTPACRAQLALVLSITALMACSSPLVRSDKLPSVHPGGPSFVETIAAHTDARFLAGNHVEVLLNGDETFPAMLRAIAEARRTITLAQYFFADGPISDQLSSALAERCRAGIKAHVLLDSFGASSIPDALVELMQRAGCEVEWFQRINLVQFLTPWELLSYNNRSHRRIVVVDGTIGFTGGYGISTAWMGDGRQPDHWRDTNVRVAGPVVHQLQSAFAQDWRETTGAVLGGESYFPSLVPEGDVTAQIVSSSPGGGASDSYMLFVLAIATAREAISITNPYFVIDDEMRDALIAAARRGVRVTVIVPGRLESELVRVDQNLVHYAGRGEFGPLLAAGIRIFEYQAALLHAKTMVVDGRWATIGSTNFDRRSFALNKEINLTAYDTGVAARMEQIFRDDLSRSDELTQGEWRSRSVYERVLQWFAMPAKSQL